MKSPLFERSGSPSVGDAGFASRSAQLKTDERFVLFDRQSGLPIKGRRYRATHEDGTSIEGVTDDEGRTSILKASTVGDVEFRLLLDGGAEEPAS